jgi:hypothetical protein
MELGAIALAVPVLLRKFQKKRKGTVVIANPAVMAHQVDLAANSSPTEVSLEHEEDVDDTFFDDQISSTSLGGVSFASTNSRPDGITIGAAELEDATDEPLLAVETNERSDHQERYLSDLLLAYSDSSVPSLF